MIEKLLRTGSGKILIRMPSGIDEITIGQLIELQERPQLNDLEAISILSGTPLSDVLNINKFEDLHVFGQVIMSLSGQIKTLHEFNAVPRKVTFDLPDGPLTVDVLKNLAIEPAGAFFAAREIIGDEINDHIKKYGPDDWQATFNPGFTAYCQVLAHYFYCRVTGKPYNEYGAEEFVKYVKTMRAVEALPVSSLPRL